MGAAHGSSLAFMLPSTGGGRGVHGGGEQDLSSKWLLGALLNCYPVLGLCLSQPKAVYPKGLPQSQGWEARNGSQVELVPAQGTGFYIGQSWPEDG